MENSINLFKYLKLVSQPKRVKSIDLMQNISRRNMMVELVKEIANGLNAIAEMTKTHESEILFSKNNCYKEKRIGKFYACFLEDNKTQALGHKQLYVRMDQALELLLKKSSAKLQKIQ